MIVIIKRVIPFFVGVVITVLSYELLINEEIEKQGYSEQLINTAYQLQSMNTELELLRDNAITDSQKVEVLEASTTTTIQSILPLTRDLLDETKGQSEKELLSSIILTSERLIHDVKN